MLSAQAERVVGVDVIIQSEARLALIHAGEAATSRQVLPIRHRSVAEPMRGTQQDVSVVFAKAAPSAKTW